MADQEVAKALVYDLKSQISPDPYISRNRL